MSMKQPPRPRRQPGDSRPPAPSPSSETHSSRASQGRGSAPGRPAQRDEVTPAHSSSPKTLPASSRRNSADHPPVRRRPPEKSPSLAVTRHEQPSPRSDSPSDRRGSSTPDVVQAMRTLRRPTGQHNAVDVLGSHDKDAAATNVERIDELIHARRTGRLRTIVLLVGSIMVAGLVVWIAFFSALFALDPSQVKVTGGNERFTNEQAQSMLAAHAPTPITRLSTQSLAQELLEHPQVKGARVTRDWPTGLSVTLETRQPRFVQQTDQGYVLVDEEGIDLGVTPEKPDLPVVVLPEDPGMRAQAAQDIAFVSGLLPEGLRVNVSEWRSEAHQISMKFTDGRIARWGTREDSEIKAKVLGLLIEQRFAQVYDVSSPTKPTTSDR